uniref:Amiloride-sensitive sodium channel n=1 Tax=Haemonchus placei TaxID=6290 RepID=A0A0N4WQ88_HAEPC
LHINFVFRSLHHRHIGFKQRASQIILRVPAAHIRRIKETEGIGSISRETQHFSQTTTMHGPKRIYQGKRFSTHFWVLMMLVSGILFIFQVAELVSMYLSKPIVSQVSFLINDEGMDFPSVTLCNFNPIRKSYIKHLNATGDFSNELLEYLLQSLMDTQALYSNADRAELHVGDRALQVYQEQHPNFTIGDFFEEAGFNCTETMKLCSFGGRQFDCCKFMEPRLTNLGKCHTLDMRNAREWMQKQTVAGANAGLQIILDTHMEEQFDETGDDADAIFSNAFENGFRYYVHAPDTIPYLVSEGISVSPGSRVYSAISTHTYVLLPSDNWGNCSNKWPQSYHTDLTYSSVNCESLCKKGVFRTELTSIKRFLSLVIHLLHFVTFILKYILIYRSNFLTVNVFHRDMAHTEYRQVKSTSVTEILSDIGGNMGMFLGMSLITVTEISLFISKIAWIAFSKRRRDYLFNKKKREIVSSKGQVASVDELRLFRVNKFRKVILSVLRKRRNNWKRRFRYTLRWR